MTAVTQQNRCNAWFNSRLAQITSIQAVYFAANGGYFQGLLSHLAPITSVGAGGAGDRHADNLESHPTDQVATWEAAGFGPPLTTQIMPCTLKLHTYVGTLGKGWVAVLSFIFDGDTWEMRYQLGPETDRAQSWSILFGPS